MPKLPRSISRVEALKLRVEVHAFIERNPRTQADTLKFFDVGQGTLYRILHGRPCDRTTAYKIRERMKGATQ